MGRNLPALGSFSAKLKRPQVDQNRVILTMSLADGPWLVSKLEAF